MSRTLCVLLLFYLLLNCTPPIASHFPYVPQCHEANTCCIYIDPNNGSNDISCLKTSDSQIAPCKNLSFAFNVSYRFNHTVYVLSNGTHVLETVETFQALNDISFIGTGINESVIQCQVYNGSGLSFYGVSNLHFTNLSVSNCSSSQNSTSLSEIPHKKLVLLVALYFYRCKNLTMNYVSVRNSPNATGVVVYDTTGMNVISHSKFSNNAVFNSPGGGGFYVEFTYCIPGSNNCSDNDRLSYTDQNHNSTYIFDSCTFENNVAQANTHSNAIYLVPYRSNHIALGRGGGLSIFFKGNARSNAFNIKNCNFTNNSANWGAGLFVEFHDDTYNNEVNIERCFMHLNHCPFTAENGTAGGGMRLGHYVFGNGNHSLHVLPPNRITVNGCNFSNNSAFNGGGMSISPTVQNVDAHQVAKILINSTTFEKNCARLGAGLHISRFAMILDGDILQVALRNCTFNFNSIDFVNYLQRNEIRAYQPGLGAVYVNQVPVVFLYFANFTNNNGSALVAIGSSLNFSDCSSWFLGNQGMKGGAIALLGLAFLRVNDNTELFFLSNLATIDGGAIYNRYIERENLISYGNCFIRHSNHLIGPEKWNSTIVFSYNFDQSGNRTSAIFSTSIFPCAWAGGSLVNQNLSRVFCWNDNWNYDPPNCTNHIHSDIGKVSFYKSSNIVRAFPGRKFNIPIELSDDLAHDLGHQNVFRATLNGYYNRTTLIIPQYIWKQETSINGNVSSDSKLLLDGVGDHAWHIVVKVKLEDCPPGFKFDGQRLNCVCVPNSYSGAVQCGTSDNPHLKNNTWMGKVNQTGDYLVGLCPPQYCFSNETVLPNKSDLLENQICGKYHRNGTLCGRCIDNYSVTVNTKYYECINCTGENVILNRVKYVAAVYIPLTLLFSLIIIFNIRLTSAAANSFILFSQVISSTFDLSADGQIPYSAITGGKSRGGFIQIYKYIYGIFNLEFIEQFLHPLCVGDISPLEAISLDYIVAFFPLVMILLILVLYKLWSCIRIPCCRTQQIRHFIIPHRRMNISQALLPAFAAFFLLSYNKFSQISSLLVGSQSLVSDSGDAATIEGGLRVYYEGSYSFYDPHYQRYYLIPACIIFGTFVAIPPILLLDFPIKLFEKGLSKIGFLWRKYPVDKVHILLDTFQGCFKNNMRIFAGLYFLFRLVVNTAYNVTTLWLTQYLFQQIACLVMVALLLVCQPYNKNNKMFNIIDPLIFLNLGALNIISFYLLSVSSSPHNNDYMYLLIVQYVLLLLPLVYMLSFLAWYFLKPCVKKLKVKLLNSIPDQKKVNFAIIRNVATSQQVEVSDESDEEEALLKRAESCNTYRPTSTLVEISDVHERTGEQRESSDSGLRSARTTSSNDYGSLRNSTRSTKTSLVSN